MDVGPFSLNMVLKSNALICFPTSPPVDAWWLGWFQAALPKS